MVYKDSGLPKLQHFRAQMAVVMLPQYTRGTPDDKSVMILAAGCALFSVAVCFVSMLMGSIAAAVFTFVVLFISLLKGLMFLSNLVLRVENMELKEQLISRWERELQYEKKKSRAQEEMIKMRDDELKQLYATVENLTESVCFLSKQLKDIRDMVVCPIAYGVPLDPVITSTGIMYSHGCFEAYKKRMGKETCPMTCLPVKYVCKALVIKEICEKIIKLMNNGEIE